MTKDRKPYPSETQDRFIVRFPEGMRDRIREEAERNGRSMNAEIIHILQQNYDREDSLKRDVKLGNITSTSLPFNGRAILKVMSQEESAILQNRVQALGGLDEVLNTPRKELLSKLQGHGSIGEEREYIAYYSRIVGETPATAIFTSEEIKKIAERLKSIHDAHKEVFIPEKDGT